MTSQSLGETYDPFGAHLQDPYPLYARARQEPVFFSPAVSAWVVSRYHDVQEALRSPEVFSSANAIRPLGQLHPAAIAELRKGYPSMPRPIITDGEEHRRVRAPLARALSGPQVDKIEPYIRQRAEELVDTFAADGHADLMSQYAMVLPVDVIVRLFDLAPEDVETARAGSYGGLVMVHSQVEEDRQAAGIRDFIGLQRLCGRYAHLRRAEPGDDVISEVIAALVPGDEPLTFEQEAQVAQVALQTFLAGHVTTTALIGNAVRHLLTHTDQWEMLRRQPDLIPGAVEEIARYDTSVQGFLRVTTRPVTLGGVDLPAGAEVLLVYGSANRDEALCERPDTFDVTRPPTRHLAFAAGPHTCVGAGLARRELVVTLQTLTRRLPDLRLAAPQQITRHDSLSAHGPTRLELVW